MSTPAARNVPAIPPDRGSFPLDHDGQCHHVVKQYMKCLKEQDNINIPCRSIQAAYMKCRMNK